MIQGAAVRLPFLDIKNKREIKICFEKFLQQWKEQRRKFISKHRTSATEAGNVRQLRLRSLRMLVAMQRWTGEESAFAVKAFYRNAESYVAAQRQFRQHFHLPPRARVPDKKTIKIWVQNFENTGQTTKKTGGSAKTIRTPENVEVVREAIARSPRRSARRLSFALGISDRSLRRILHQDLHMHPYKIQIVQALNPNDSVIRRDFCENILQLFEDNPRLIHNLWMSDEAHFHMSGYVNKQNYRYWAEANPHQLHERPLHSAKVTVWCAISSKGIIGPYFFEDDNEKPVTVTSERYAHMLETFLIPELERFPVNENTHFQQDGATSHTARISMDILRRIFPNKLINGDIHCPPRSPNLVITFLWGYLKVFATRPIERED